MNEKRTIQEIANLLAEKHGMTRKDADLFIRTFLDIIEESLPSEKYVKIKGLGTFKLTEVDSRESVDINTGERIEIQGHTKVSFTPDTTMKELINKPFSHFETVVLNEGVTLEDTPTEAEAEEVQTALPTEENPATPVVLSEEVPTVEEVPAIEELPAATEAEPEPVQEKAPEESQEEVSVSQDEAPEAQEEAVSPTETSASQPEEIPTTLEEQPTPAEEVPSASPEEQPTTQEEEPSLQEEPEKEAVAASVFLPDEEKKSSHFLWGIIAVLVLIILFGFYWLFLRPADDAVEQSPATPPVQEEVTTPAPITEDTTQVAIVDNPIYIGRLNLTPEELRKERVPVLADTLEYRTDGTQSEYILEHGETIIKVSVKFFGSKKFWPYIAKYNSATIKDPDNIPVGTSILIPHITVKQ